MKVPQAREQQAQEHFPPVVITIAITNIRRGQEELLGVADRVKGRGSGMTDLTRDSMNIVINIDLRFDRRPLFGIC